MAPNQNFSLNSVPLEPISRTYQYRKVMKPLLERKRRARINHCLDELKELMTSVFQAEGENVAKLEKADILELTVRHLHGLRDKNALFIRKDSRIGTNDRFWDGFRQCAGEVSQFLTKFDTTIGNHLINHINNYTRNMENYKSAPPQIPIPSNLQTEHRPQMIQQKKNSGFIINYHQQNNKFCQPKQNEHVWRPW